jgi:hypothetical protein
MAMDAENKEDIIPWDFFKKGSFVEADLIGSLIGAS